MYVHIHIWVIGIDVITVLGPRLYCLLAIVWNEVMRSTLMESSFVESSYHIRAW